MSTEYGDEYDEQGNRKKSSPPVPPRSGESRPPFPEHSENTSPALHPQSSAQPSSGYPEQYPHSSSQDYQGSYAEPQQYSADHRQSAARTTEGEDRTWSSIAHIVPLAAMWLSAGVAGFIASIVIFIIGKEKGPFIRNYTAQALNIQLNALIWFVLSWILVFVLIGLIMLPIVAIWATVLHVLAIMKANQGEVWKPPFCIEFIK